MDSVRNERSFGHPMCPEFMPDMTLLIWYFVLISYSYDTSVVLLYGTKESGGNEASCYYPIMHLFKYDIRVSLFDCKCYDPLFLDNYNMARLGDLNT